MTPLYAIEEQLKHKGPWKRFHPFEPTSNKEDALAYAAANECGYPLRVVRVRQ